MMLEDMCLTLCKVEKACLAVFYQKKKIQQQERCSSIEAKIEDLWTEPTLCYKQLKLGRGGAAVRCNSAKNLLESGS